MPSFFDQEDRLKSDLSYVILDPGASHRVVRALTIPIVDLCFARGSIDPTNEFIVGFIDQVGPHPRQKSLVKWLANNVFINVVPTRDLQSLRLLAGQEKPLPSPTYERERESLKKSAALRKYLSQPNFDQKLNVWARKYLGQPVTPCNSPEKQKLKILSSMSPDEFWILSISNEYGYHGHPGYRQFDPAVLERHTKSLSAPERQVYLECRAAQVVACHLLYADLAERYQMERYGWLGPDVVQGAKKQIRKQVEHTAVTRGFQSKAAELWPDLLPEITPAMNSAALPTALKSDRAAEVLSALREYDKVRDKEISEYIEHNPPKDPHPRGVPRDPNYRGANPKGTIRVSSPKK